MSLLIELLAGPAALKPAIDDIVALLLRGKVTHAEAARLVAVRDAKAKEADEQAAAEGQALAGSYRKGKAMYAGVK